MGNTIKFIKMKALVEILNEASDAYYNGKEVLMTDQEFDLMLKQLSDLEKETGIIFSKSPTINVGAPVLNNLDKVKHEYKPMLSLEKVHSAEEVVKFAKGKELVAMIKLDGLSVRLTYQDKNLIKAETRGDGVEGSLITEHIKQFKNVPLTIDKEGIYIVDGEAIISKDDFDKINASLPNGVEKYKNSRNLASGTLSLLDTSLVKDRQMQFVLWDVIVGEDSNDFWKRIKNAESLGFDVVPIDCMAASYWNLEKNNKNIIPSVERINESIDFIFSVSKLTGYPNDGVVFRINDIAYGETLGQTSHHFCNAVAYKAAQECFPTTLIDVKWTMGKTGSLCPTIVTEPVEIDGTMVERASVHNCTIFKEFGFSKGCTCYLYKANQIIPQCSYVEDTTDDLFEIPTVCPICGAPTEIRKDNDTEVLYCTSDFCSGKLLGKLKAFVSKQGMDIDGLSEATLSLLLDRGYVSSFKDLYHLSDYKAELSALPKMGAKSVAKLLDAIEKSRHTTLDKFITALSIPLVGKSTAKDLSKYCNGDVGVFVFIMNNTSLEFASIDGIGVAAVESLDDWWNDNYIMVSELLDELVIENETEDKPIHSGTDLNGATFCITGKLIHYSNRDALVKEIENCGGKYVSSVSSKTNYLINNDKESKSSKNIKAAQCGCKVISEADFIQMCGLVDVIID